MGYGWYSFDMEELEGQEKKVGRAGIMLHGGGSACGWPGAWAPQQPLHPTLGCIRLHNADLRDNLGRVVAAAGVAATVPHELLSTLLDRHAACDWGDLSGDDRAVNDVAARTGDGRLLSSYATAEHGRLWIITNDIRGESDGPLTTLMAPDV